MVSYYFFLYKHISVRPKKLRIPWWEVSIYVDENWISWIWIRLLIILHFAMNNPLILLKWSWLCWCYSWARTLARQFVLCVTIYLTILNFTIKNPITGKMKMIPFFALIFKIPKLSLYTKLTKFVTCKIFSRQLVKSIYLTRINF